MHLLLPGGGTTKGRMVNFDALLESGDACPEAISPQTVMELGGPIELSDFALILEKQLSPNEDERVRLTKQKEENGKSILDRSKCSKGTVAKCSVRAREWVAND